MCVCLDIFNAYTKKCVESNMHCSVNVFVGLKVRMKGSTIKKFTAKMVEIYGRFQFLKNSNTLIKQTNLNVCLVTYRLSV